MVQSDIIHIIHFHQTFGYLTGYKGQWENRVNYFFFLHGMLQNNLGLSFHSLFIYLFFS